MTEFIMQYWVEAAFGVVVLAFGGIGKWIRLQSAENKAVKLGLQAILRDRVVQAYYHYYDRGWITLHGLENVENLYKEYHNLGGNGTVTKLVEDLREMAVRERE